jgi:hypothetical protein
MAKRYGKLPCEILAQASTIDLMVLDIAISYENMKVRESRGEKPQPKTEDLEAALKKFKG